MLLLVLAVVAAALMVLFVWPGSTPRIDNRLHPNGIAVLEQVPAGAQHTGQRARRKRSGYV
jgi:hypothetical protein